MKARHDFHVTWTGEPEIMDAGAHIVPKAVDGGQRVTLQVLDSNWRSTEGNIPELQDLIVERAWLLVAGQVVEQFTDGELALRGLPTGVELLVNPKDYLV